MIGTGLVIRLRLDGDGDKVRDADDKRDDVDKNHGELSTSDVAVHGTLTWKLNHDVSKTRSSPDTIHYDHLT